MVERTNLEKKEARATKLPSVSQVEFKKKKNSKNSENDKKICIQYYEGLLSRRTPFVSFVFVRTTRDIC